MANYIWQCHDCKIYWDREYALAKNPHRTKCPECRKLCERLYNPTPVHFKGAGWTGVNSATGFNKQGGSDEINKKLQGECEERMKSGYQHYARYTPKQGWLDQNVTKQFTEREARERMESTRKMTNSLYDKHGIDRKEANTKKPQ